MDILSFLLSGIARKGLVCPGWHFFFYIYYRLLITWQDLNGPLTKQKTNLLQLSLLLLWAIQATNLFLCWRHFILVWTWNRVIQEDFNSFMNFLRKMPSLHRWILWMINMNVNFTDHNDIDKEEFLIEKKRILLLLLQLKDRRPLYAQKYITLGTQFQIYVDFPQNCCYYC